MFPPLPPNSRQTLLIVSAAFLEINFPALVEPVKETISISVWLEISVPTPAPSPFTKLKTPFGNLASSIISANNIPDIGAISEGFKIMVHPVAKAGATLAAGGPELPNGLNKGYFIKPTIFTDVTNEMRIAKEEIFGPVLSIIPFDTEDEAVKIVNDTSYGLGNYLQTDDKEKAHRVAKKLRSGCVYINGNAADVGTPFGGYRQSGNGREGGVWGLEEFLEVKNVTGWN